MTGLNLGYDALDDEGARELFDTGLTNENLVSIE